MNQCNFIGRLGKDVENRYSQAGDACANFSIAIGNKWRDKQTGEQKEHTEWVNVCAYKKLAEICGEYLKKGDLVRISGKIRSRKWQDKNGQDRYTTEIIASEMQMLGGNRDSGGRNGASQGKPQQQGGGYNQAPQQQANNQPQQGGYANNQQAPQNNGGFDDFHDDIPF